MDVPPGKRHGFPSGAQRRRDAACSLSGPRFGLDGASNDRAADHPCNRFCSLAPARRLKSERDLQSIAASQPSVDIHPQCRHQNSPRSLASAASNDDDMFKDARRRNGDLLYAVDERESGLLSRQLVAEGPRDIPDGRDDSLRQ